MAIHTYICMCTGKPPWIKVVKVTAPLQHLDENERSTRLRKLTMGIARQHRHRPRPDKRSARSTGAEACRDHVLLAEARIVLCSFERACWTPRRMLGISFCRHHSGGVVVVEGRGVKQWKHRGIYIRSRADA